MPVRAPAPAPALAPVDAPVLGPVGRPAASEATSMLTVTGSVVDVVLSWEAVRGTRDLFRASKKSEFRVWSIVTRRAARVLYEHEDT